MPNQGIIVPPTYQWNLTLERQLAPSWMAELAYVGMSGSNQVEEQNLNPAVYIPGITLSDDQRRFISNEYGNIAMISEYTNMNFNALEVSLEKRMRKRLSIEANYTWSKGLNDIPGTSLGNSGRSNTISCATAPTISVYPWYAAGRHQMDYGPATFNMTNRFVAAYNYDLPALSRLNGVASSVLRSWEWTGIATAQSSYPFTVTAGEDRSETRLDEDRAVQIGPAFGAGACAVQARA
jgi:hypothetical protein